MNLDTLLKQKRPVITDGAMGTYFTQKTGFSIHECEWANISRPELISEIHREYVRRALNFENEYLFGRQIALGRPLADVLEIVRAGYRLA